MTLITPVAPKSNGGAHSIVLLDPLPQVQQAKIGICRELKEDAVLSKR